MQAITAPEVPGYELLEPIGEGGMGTVYRALQQRLHRVVAIKFLHPLSAVPNRTGSHPVLELAGRTQEPELLARVNHPHVVTIHDSGERAGQPYLVMEYLGGPSLRSLMTPGDPWPPDRALPILGAIADALTAIHARGLLHLDLKPENVLSDERGLVKLTDFGLCLPQVDACTLSELGLVSGSLDYCPPEQRHGLPITPRADLFALATLAYELLTGRLPGRVYRPASHFNRQLSLQVDEVLRRGLARDPEERQASVAEFRRELETALESCRCRAPWPAMFLIATLWAVARFLRWSWS
jgi:serine/threonine protein kinase